MSRTIKNSLFGLVASAALTPAFAQTPPSSEWQDRVPDTIKSASPVSTRAFALIEAFVAAGYDAQDATNDSIDVTQPADNEIAVGDANPTGGMNAVVSSQRLQKIEFTIDAFDAREVGDGSEIIPDFDCGLVYDGTFVAVDVLGAEPLPSGSLSDVNAAAKKVAQAIEIAVGELADASIVVTQQGNKVSVAYGDAESVGALHGAMFGAKRFKVSVRMFTTDRFDGAYHIFKIRTAPEQTGGPLLPPLHDVDMDSAGSLGLEPQELDGN